MLRRSWTEISLSAIRNNYRIYSSYVKKGQSVMAVVKADAYGHGDANVAKALQDEGCENFAVSNINEAINLRKAGIKGQILILGYTPEECAEDLKKYDITQALLSESFAERMSGSGIKAQFAIDTGMNRIGLDADDPAACEAIIRKYADKFTLTGIFTHLCVADTPSEEDFTASQIAKFEEVARSVADLKLPFAHCLNSAGGLFYDEPSHGNLVRLGIILYGLKPDRENVLPDGIRPALEWKTVISMLKTVHKGESVGYGRTWTAESDRIVATLPTGYADGYQRALSGKGKVLINGRPAPLVGRVCMDQMTVDVTDVPGVREGDEVTLIGEGYNADAMAADAGTIGYEILCAISPRVERVYKD